MTDFAEPLLLRKKALFHKDNAKPSVYALKFTATGASSFYIGNITNPDLRPVLYKSTDGITWSSWNRTSINLNDGETVYIKGNNPNGLTRSDNSNVNFIMTGTIACSGNIMSLLGENITEIPSMYCFKRLFDGCSSLISAPELPATVLTDNCYYQMFRGCTALLVAPELPATNLAKNCYNSMFVGCTSLTAAPELLAPTISDRGYFNMFTGCSNLNYVKCLATNAVGSTYSTSWLEGVSSTGTFIKDPSKTWSSGSSGIPTGWTVIDNN